MNNKLLKTVAASILLGFSLGLHAEESAAVPEMTVYRSPGCSCCGKWLEHMQHSGFTVKTVMSDDMQAIKEKLGIPDKLASCHTATVDGYVVEGHIPAGDVRKLLLNKPAVAGIAAPNMPLGSPGMEAGGQKQAYQVMSFDKQGRVAIFAEHGGD
ncbi:MAG: DUF411 domain-containing protein [Methylococcales bacterium]|nr:DUF411 domain-containing protein [Methylococcales bacterium]